ncbi:hypothetical protein ACEQ6C_38390, partial [Rhizobium ruizarguesonis]
LDADKDHDYIFVTFTSAISTTGDYKNVLKTSNYTIDGKDLPLGSQIVAGIEGYTDATPDVVDSITIILPDGIGCDTSFIQCFRERYFQSSQVLNLNIQCSWLTSVSQFKHWCLAFLANTTCRIIQLHEDVCIV